MECFAYCTAAAYSIKTLYASLKSRFQVELYRDALRIELSLPQGCCTVFCFEHGSTIFWGASSAESLSFLKELKPFEFQSMEEMEKDEFEFRYGSQASIEEDMITLPDESNLTKLAISYGIAQSVKLGAFESAIQTIYNRTKGIPQELAHLGRISLSRREIRKRMGELFTTRSSINLHIDALDAPEFFWEHPAQLEALYNMTSNYLNIKPRLEALNLRLSIVHELFEMLGSELNHQHSSRLEWTIIILIVIEVVITLLIDVFRLL